MIELLQVAGIAVILHIILIDLLLSADNALAIALACRKLDARQRLRGLLFGTLAAVVLRLALIFVALNLMGVPGLKIVLAVVLAAIAVRLFNAKAAQMPAFGAGVTWLAAVKAIVLADFVMSLDNVVAVASAVEVGAPTLVASQQLWLVVIGLVISVPVMALGASVLLKLFDRLPWLVLAGVGLLGWIAAGLLISDSFVVNQIGTPSVLVTLVTQTIGAVAVMVLARWWASRA